MPDHGSASRASQLTESAFAISSNGAGDGPAEALRDYLVERGSSVLVIRHPLTAEHGRRHLVTSYEARGTKRSSVVRTPVRPPLSYALDPLIPLRVPKVDVWFGFNPLACARGLAQRRLGRAGRVVMWSVDYVPDRFGHGTQLTRLYDRVDRHCCERSDLRVELSEAARAARDEHHALGNDAARTRIVPMGAWLERVPTTTRDSFDRRNVVFLGHLVKRQGVATLLEAVALLRGHEIAITADVIGGGPLEHELRERARALGVSDVVRFHGFVADHRDVERILSSASLAVAPYESSPTTFTKYADPGKLKAYLAAGLPIVLTDVPPNAKELSEHAGARISESNPGAIASALEEGLSSRTQWEERRSAALRFARHFDWPHLIDPVFTDLGWLP